MSESLLSQTDVTNPPPEMTDKGWRILFFWRIVFGSYDELFLFQTGIDDILKMFLFEEQQEELSDKEHESESRQQQHDNLHSTQSRDGENGSEEEQQEEWSDRKHSNHEDDDEVSLHEVPASIKLSNT